MQSNSKMTLQYTPWVCATLLFGFMLYLYVRILPVVAWNGDDWVYLAQFRDLFPSLTRWNPARLLPEVLQPLVGWTASCLYALGALGSDYIQALIWSHALLLATGVTALGIGLYYALRRVSGNAPLALFAVVLFMALCFSLFKSRPYSVFLFFSDSLTISSFYVIPNVLNSILVCLLLYGHAGGRALDTLQPGTLRAGMLICVLFLAQFSMTFGSAILAVFAGWICLWRLWQQPVASIRQKITRYAKTGTFFDAILLIILFFWITASVLDMFGGRYARLQQAHWDFAGAWQAFAGLLGQINPATGVVVFVILLTTLLRFAYKRVRHTWNTTDSQFFILFVLCLLSALALFGLDILISARTTSLCGRISVAYNVFFYVVLNVTLCACYLLQDMPRIYLIAPLIVLLLLVECQNSEKPWARQSPQEHALVARWLHEVREAEQQGETSVAISVPTIEWPHPKEWFGKALSYTLFVHGVTPRRMDITLREIHYPPRER